MARWAYYTADGRLVTAEQIEWARRLREIFTGEPQEHGWSDEHGYPITDPARVARAKPAPTYAELKAMSDDELIRRASGSED